MIDISDGGKSLVTDSKRSLISFGRILTFPEQCVLEIPCRLSLLILTPAIFFTLFHYRFGCSFSSDCIFFVILSLQ